MKSNLVEKPVEVWHLDDYVKCPNYSKYNWTNGQIRHHHFLYSPLREVITSCYRDLSNLEKKIQWKTVRGRIHRELAPLLQGQIELEDYQRIAITSLEQIRNWYLKSFREGPTTCLHNLWLESHVPATGVSVAGNVDAILLAPDHVRIVEITDKFKDIREALTSLSLRSKVWLLKAQGIEVSQIQVVRINEHRISTDTLNIQSNKDFIYKTERALQWATGSIKNQIFHPSVTDMCTSCPYREICAW